MIPLIELTPFITAHTLDSRLLLRRKTNEARDPLAHLNAFDGILLYLITTACGADSLEISDSGVEDA